jgi:hypothetical protein
MKAVSRAGAELGLDLIEGWKQIEYKFVARFSRFDWRIWKAGYITILRTRCQTLFTYEHCSQLWIV